MAGGPEGFEVATVDDAAAEAEEMFVIALRKDVFVVSTGNLDGSGIGMLEPAEGEGKARALHAETLFDDAAAVADLMFELCDVVVIDAVMVECVRAKEETTLLQFVDLAPFQRMLAWALAHFFGEVLKIFCFATFAGVNEVGIYEEHGVNAIPLEFRSYLRITIAKAVIEGESQSATFDALAAANHPERFFKIHKVAMLMKPREQSCKALSVGIVIVVPIYHVSIENVDKRGWLAERSCNAEVSISKKCAEWIRHIFYEQMTFFNTVI